MDMNADQSKGDSVDEAAAAEEEKPLYVDDVMKQVEEAAEADSTEEEETGEAGAEQKDQADDPLFDLGDIMKNLPETDSELKAMIDEMI